MEEENIKKVDEELEQERIDEDEFYEQEGAYDWKKRIGRKDDGVGRNDERYQWEI